MKKFSVSLLVCVLVLSGCFLFTGCNNSELDKYAELKETLFELQANSDELYNDYIYIFGIKYNQYDGLESASTTGYRISLRDVIILENCIWARSSNHMNYYWFYFDIERIEDENDSIIWSR